jgi:hypothetical protein
MARPRRRTDPHPQTVTGRHFGGSRSRSRPLVSLERSRPTHFAVSPSSRADRGHYDAAGPELHHHHGHHASLMANSDSGQRCRRAHYSREGDVSRSSRV